MMIQTAIESMPSRRTAPRVLTLVRDARPEDEPGTVDEPVLAAYLAGEPGSADRLVATFGTVVRDAIARFLATRRRGQVDLADDLTHEVLIALLRNDGRKLRTFAGRHGCSFAGWLKVVAVRHTIDHLRRDGKLVALDDDAPGMVELRRSLRSDDPDPEQIAVGTETAERLAEAMAQLPPKDRVLVELHVVRGTSLADVARVLGVTMNAAYVRKSRVLERLRRALGRPR
jgi:RNA polymerase sigma-70 factor (ECF subfamily)